MTYKGWRGRENMGCLATCGVYDKRWGMSWCKQ